MKKVLGLLAVLGFLFYCTQASAAPWAVVATVYYDPVDSTLDATQINTIDLGVSPPKVYGPFLSGKLGSAGGGLFDIVVVPGQRYALVSNFGDSTVHRIDLKDPTNPVWLGKVAIPFFAEDIACTPDGKLALVTDGGFSPRIAFIDLETFTLASNFYLGSLSAQSVAVAPNNSTVLFVDYFSSKVHYGTINKNRTGLINMGSIFLCDGVASVDPVTGSDVCTNPDYDGTTDHNNTMGRPVNVTISPNGKTALVAISNAGYVAALELKSNGQVVPGNPFFIGGLGGTWDNSSTSDYENTDGDQSIAFQSDAKAYVVNQPHAYEDPDNSSHMIEPPIELVALKIGGPGAASLIANSAIPTTAGGTSQLFGVDSLAITGWQAVMGNPTVSGAVKGKLTYVNLHTKQYTPLNLNNDGLATGVAIKYY